MDADITRWPVPFWKIVCDMVQVNWVGFALLLQVTPHNAGVASVVCAMLDCETDANAVMATNINNKVVEHL